MAVGLGRRRVGVGWRSPAGLLLNIVIGDHTLQAVIATRFVPVRVSGGSDDGESVSTFEGKIL